MTLVVTVNSPESIWLLADRRLSFNAHSPRDDARKIMFLETQDGVAILGYAGLGATARGTEPADWMSSVLRGRNLPLEQSLDVLAKAMKREFPQHMVRMPGGGGPVHNLIVTAFLGNEARLYTIDLVFAPNRKTFHFRWTRHIAEKPGLATPRTPRLMVGGTGGQYLIREKKWIRPLLRKVRAYDRFQVKPQAVADHLARLNNEVHLGVTDNSVGPRCIVAWRNRKGGVHKGGGAQVFYNGTKRDVSQSSLPVIANGMDVSAIAGVLIPHVAKMFEAIRGCESSKEPDKDEINQELARLPDKPDENLR